MKYAYHEPTASVIPHLPGTQTDACTYSLIHRPSFGSIGPRAVTGVAERNHRKSYLATNRTAWINTSNSVTTTSTKPSGQCAPNDAHNAPNTPPWIGTLEQRDKWKQNHAGLALGTRENLPPFGSWSAFDYARDKVQTISQEEVSRNIQSMVCCSISSAICPLSKALLGASLSARRDQLTRVDATSPRPDRHRDGAFCPCCSSAHARYS